MRLNSFLTILLVFLFVQLGFSQATSAQKTPEEIMQEIVRLRAQEIEAQDARKKAEEALEKKDSPAMKRARKEIEKEQKRLAKQEEEAAETLMDAKVVGCKNVVVMDDLNVTNLDRDTVEVSSNATKGSRFRVMLSLRIINNDVLAFDTIETSFRGYGPVVRNLCSRGSVTLTFNLAWEDADSVDIPITIVARPPDGGIATTTRTFNLNKLNQQSRRVDNQNWEVHVYRQYQTR